MKILFISDSLNPDHGSGPKASLSLIHNLTKEGFEVVALHYNQININLEKVKTIVIYEEKWTPLFIVSRIQRMLQRWSGINIAWKMERIFGFSPTFFNDVKSLEKGLKTLIRDESPDFIITCSKGASFRPHFALMNLREAKGKWLAYIHDPFPFSCYPPPYEWKDPGQALKKDRFQKMLSAATFIAYPSKLLADWMCNFYDYDRDKEIIIPHQMTTYSFLKNECAVPEWWDNERFNVLHAGNLMDKRNPEGLLNAWIRFQKLRPEAAGRSSLIFAGSGNPHQNLRETPDAQNSDVFFSGHIPFTTALHLQYRASVNVILESISEISPFLPGKFPHCVQANRPILLLAPKKSESLRLLGEEYSYWSLADDADKILDILIQLYDKWQSQKGEKYLNRPDLVDYLSSGRLKEQLNQILAKPERRTDGKNSSNG